ncbi:fibroblast growth factor 9-like [Argiope bruennichi]|uniref:fibroblast growth factor 9-like n=1 Tax=Argiope bruennichi TaxID=94029 RepID=UPI0024955D4E|nr:fibroblast growth factor 9-like [Argiope bruennichi]
MALRLWWLIGMICIINGHGQLSKTRRGYLRCRTGVTLEVHPDGVINGTKGKGGKFANLQIIVSKEGRNVTFFGIHSKFYLCMSSDGKLYGSKLMMKECVFKVLELPYHFTSYYRRIGRRKNLFMGLSRSGKPRWGRQRSKRTQFIWSKSRNKREYRIKWKPPQLKKQTKNLKKNTNGLL